MSNLEVAVVPSQQGKVVVLRRYPVPSVAGKKNKFNKFLFNLFFVNSTLNTIYDDFFIFKFKL